MKTDIKHLILSCFVAVVFVSAFESCDKSDLPVYNTKDRIWFTRYYYDSKKWEYIYVNDITRTFALYPGQSSILVPFQVNLMGNTANHDREFQAVAVDSLTTMSESEYKIVSSTLRAGYIVDTLWVQLNKTPRMDDKEYTLTLHVAENENFSQGYSNSLQVKITVSNKAARPDWWDDEMSLVYLGDYTEAKFIALYNFLIDNSVDTEEFIEMAPSLKRKILLQFKIYIVTNNLHDSDGELISIPII